MKHYISRYSGHVADHTIYEHINVRVPQVAANLIRLFAGAYVSGISYFDVRTYVSDLGIMICSRVAYPQNWI